MTTYLLSMFQPQGPIPGPEVLGPVMQKLGELREELEAKGSWVFGNGLTQPSGAIVLKPSGDEVLAVDGPFVETKEYLGGVTIITVADLDEALDWGRRYAAATGLQIEVRPFQ
jgi:hypothetical protein